MSVWVQDRNRISASPSAARAQGGACLPSLFYFGYFYYARPGAVALRQEALA
jgi:hypothetical protein